MYGYDEKELNVKLSGVNEITIEGFSDKTKDGSAAKHSFRRWFQLPDSVDLERTTTALSEEGILTITVPKKVGNPYSKLFHLIFSKMNITRSPPLSMFTIFDTFGVGAYHQEKKKSGVPLCHPTVRQNQLLDALHNNSGLRTVLLSWSTNSRKTNIFSFSFRTS